ncbi:hypothetical protein RRF57_002549 [Xylaria bambusicola]|uniref:Uncharacterized protein n=1 Tax=Xylaria bambusicola TaxID=326684 RepID=A0AAN7UJ55_9PEZI
MHLNRYEECYQLAHALLAIPQSRGCRPAGDWSDTTQFGWRTMVDNTELHMASVRPAAEKDADRDLELMADDDSVSNPSIETVQFHI